jgi:TRAP-type mannitol/chloroaromatic compound transport system permease large subunit
MAIALFLTVVVVLLAGFPVAFSLAGTALAFALVGTLTGSFDPTFLGATPNRIYGGIMSSDILVAVPLFVFMGVMLERARIAEDLLDTLSDCFGGVRGGLGLAVTVVGMLLAASTGIVGATVVTMGLLALPTMLRRGYSAEIATGTICASGTLGQIIPPSIVLVLLGDVLSTAYAQAQRDLGIFSPKSVSVGDLFLGALVPGLMLVALYMLYIVVIAIVRPASMPGGLSTDDLGGGGAGMGGAQGLEGAGAAHANAPSTAQRSLLMRVVLVLMPPLLLIVAVLGSIMAGLATPTEAAAVGALGATLLAAVRRELNLAKLRDVMRATARVSSMVFLILIGASIFSLVFRGFGGDELVRDALGQLPGGTTGALVAVMALMFVLGFVLDFIEITFVVVPIVGPVLLAMGVDPVWFGVMVAINLQTSFLTPPFGFALFYLRGVAPPSVDTMQIYRGVIPFVLLQLLMLGILALNPSLATWLPGRVYG